MDSLQDEIEEPAHEQQRNGNETATAENPADAEDIKPVQETVRGENGARSEPEGQIGVLDARLSELEAENSRLKDQYLRKHADMENYRKRMQREAQELRVLANKQLLIDLLPIIDDFERAIKSSEDSKDFTAFHDGIMLIEKQFAGMLERKWGLKRFESIGEPFNPDRHEAILSEEVAGHTEAVVLEDYQKGYLLNDKVIRASKVKVSIPGGQKKAPVG